MPLGAAPGRDIMVAAWGRSYRPLLQAAPTQSLLQGHSYGTTLVAVFENELSTPDVLNDVATNS